VVVVDAASTSDAPSTRALVGLAATAFAVFLFELAAMRAVAQVTWGPFAFVALSAAMLGGGLAGTGLALRPGLLRAPDAALGGAALVAVGAPAAMMLALHAGLEPLRIADDVGAAAVFVGVLAALAVPFVGLALTLSALLDAHPPHTTRLYGADLVGAALGAFVSVLVLDAVGVVGTAGLAGLSAAAAAVALARAPRRAFVVVAVAGALAGGMHLAPGVPRATVDKRVGDAPARDVLVELGRRGRLHTVDGADGRVDVVPTRDAAAVLIDLGAAVTRAPTGNGGPPAVDAAAAAFVAVPPRNGDVLVVGAGAGFEVARALQHGAAHVDAVEVSAAVVAAVTDGSIPTSQALYADPRVTLHLDEARAFLQRRTVVPTPPATTTAADRGGRRWRHVVAVHTITNAAVTANALRLAEDFLLTREALTALVAAVDDDGVLYLTRPANQIALLADLARAGVRAAIDEDAGGGGGGSGDLDGVDMHLAMLVRNVDDPFFRGLLVARRPLDRAALAAPPGHRWVEPPPTTGGALPDDDRPFFHRRADDVDAGLGARLRIEDGGFAERAVVAVGGLSILVALFTLVAPLLVARHRERRRATAELASVPSMPSVPSIPSIPTGFVGIAALLGLGFLTFELSLAQRLTLFCGRPVVAFAAVVGGLLLGAGSTALVVTGRRAPRLGTALVLSAVAVTASVFAPSVLDAVGVLGFAAAARAVVVAVVAALCGLPLGLGFPALVTASTARAPSSAPLLYGWNATVGVGAAALHGAFAPTVGLLGTTLVAASAYGVAAVLAFVVDRDPDRAR
jgi:hypothetical protein